jgi:hypothetical protein
MKPWRVDELDVAKEKLEDGAPNRSDGGFKLLIQSYTNKNLRAPMMRAITGVRREPLRVRLLKGDLEILGKLDVGRWNWNMSVACQPVKISVIIPDSNLTSVIYITQN